MYEYTTFFLFWGKNLAKIYKKIRFASFLRLYHLCHPLLSPNCSFLRSHRAQCLALEYDSHAVPLYGAVRHDDSFAAFGPVCRIFPSLPAPSVPGEQPLSLWHCHRFFMWFSHGRQNYRGSVSNETDYEAGSRFPAGFLQQHRPGLFHRFCTGLSAVLHPHRVLSLRYVWDPSVLWAVASISVLRKTYCLRKYCQNIRKAPCLRHSPGRFRPLRYTEYYQTGGIYDLFQSVEHTAQIVFSPYARIPARAGNTGLSPAGNYRRHKTGGHGPSAADPYHAAVGRLFLYSANLRHGGRYGSVHDGICTAQTLPERIVSGILQPDIPYVVTEQKCASHTLASKCSGKRSFCSAREAAHPFYFIGRTFL